MSQVEIKPKRCVRYSRRAYPCKVVLIVLAILFALNSIEKTIIYEDMNIGSLIFSLGLLFVISVQVYALIRMINTRYYLIVDENNNKICINNPLIHLKLDLDIDSLSISSYRRFEILSSYRLWKYHDKKSSKIIPIEEFYSAEPIDAILDIKLH